MQSLSDRLQVYRQAVTFHRLIQQIQARLPRGSATLTDQLQRASRSTVLNIAEAAGKASRADQRRIFQIARGSALESEACLELIEIEGLLPQREMEEARRVVRRVYAMLTGLILPPRDGRGRDQAPVRELDDGAGAGARAGAGSGAGSGSGP